MHLPAELLDVRAIAFDVDGTLAGADHLVSPRTLRALAALDAAGVEPIVVTGRIADAAVEVLTAAGIDGYVIASNGAVAVDTRQAEPLHTAVMAAQDVAALVAFALAADVEPLVFTATDMVVGEDGIAYDYLVAVHPDSVTRKVPVRSLPRDGVTKAMLFATTERLDELDDAVRAAFPRAVRSMDNVFELGPAGADKWVALAAILHRLGIEPSQVAGLGDGENDVPWLSQVGWPVAMDNAREPVKAVARLHIGHHGDDAAAAFVEDLLAARAAASRDAAGHAGRPGHAGQPGHAGHAR
ncbi:HAD-IIB family hydrolase [Georgenia yuyongxinii]|uniref:HAD-IIB family hydrolase n=1 Tax=Georgenia yuyongxinii TaxID=2589797 RepID=A0A552WWR6_9MICO|nr:HAD-IIB family hydrolase [Georgenia yuyongxinii]TRW47227.1 HAD-IIB family hydrolase [Georgenia yuyongxinii]